MNGPTPNEVSDLAPVTQQDYEVDPGFHQDTAPVPESTEPPKTKALIEELGTHLRQAAGEAREIERIKAEFEAETAVYRLRLEDEDRVIAALRAELRERMIEDGVKTMEHDGIQITRPKRTELRITDVEAAVAFLTEKGKGKEVRYLYTDEKAILRNAKLYKGMAGIEQVEQFGFTVTDTRKRQGPAPAAEPAVRDYSDVPF